MRRTRINVKNLIIARRTRTSARLRRTRPQLRQLRRFLLARRPTSESYKRNTRTILEKRILEAIMASVSVHRVLILVIMYSASRRSRMTAKRIKMIQPMMMLLQLIMRRRYHRKIITRNTDMIRTHLRVPIPNLTHKMQPQRTTILAELLMTCQPILRRLQLMYYCYHQPSLQRNRQ